MLAFEFQHLNLQPQRCYSMSEGFNRTVQANPVDLQNASFGSVIADLNVVVAVSEVCLILIKMLTKSKVQVTVKVKNYCFYFGHSVRVSNFRVRGSASSFYLNIQASVLFAYSIHEAQKHFVINSHL